MRQLIVPIAIIVALITFFVFVDRKEFNRYDVVHTIQSETLTANRKPPISVSETKAVAEEINTVEATPVVEDNLTGGMIVDSKSVFESKSVKGKEPVVEVILAEVAPLTETIKASPTVLPVATPKEAEIANNSAIQKLNKKKIVLATPEAIPVLSPEEAIKANKEAIRFQRNRAIASFFHKIGINSNRIHFVLSLLPLLLIVDLLLPKKKEKKPKSKVTGYFSLSRRMLILFSVSLLAFGLIVFVPWSVYFGNATSFPFIFQDFVNNSLSILTIAIFSTAIFLLIIPPKTCEYVLGLTVGLGLCVYIQAMFMNCYLGEMNGTEQDWNQHNIWGTVNIVIWIAIIVIPFVIKKCFTSLWHTIMTMTTEIILLLEITAIASTVLSAREDVWQRNEVGYCDFSKQFQLSPRKNIIVIIFDTMGTGFLNECFKASPETKNIIKDFTWYSNARSNYLITLYALNHELTGCLVQSGSSFDEIYKKEWESSAAKSFYTQVKKSGYDTRLFIDDPILGEKANYQHYFSNFTNDKIEYIINNNELKKCLIKISGFSALPYFFKKYFFYGNDFARNVVRTNAIGKSNSFGANPNTNQLFYKKLVSERITTDSDSPVLSFYYTLGTHKPWIVDEKCQNVRTENNPFRDPVQATKSCFFIVSEIIEQLKANNIYDQTAILICSDHGGNDPEYSTPFDMSFLVKPFNSNHDMLIQDDTKVQSIDILPTLLQFACGDNSDFESFDGYPANKIPQDRKQIVYMHFRHPDFPNLSFNGTPITSNCLKKILFTDVNSVSEKDSFIQFIPLNNTTPIDESVLIQYR